MTVLIRSLALGVFLSIAASRSSRPVDPEERIVNGVPVSANEYPWMVSLRAQVYYLGDTYFLSPFCGASLIAVSPPTILTAAHCVDANSFATDSEGQSSMYFSFVDDYLPITLHADVNRTDGDEIVAGDAFQTLNWTASQLTIHEQWNSSNIVMGYDIALIVVDDGSLTFSENDLPVIPTTELSGSEACCEDNEPLQAIGYGLNHSNGSATDTLEHTTLHFVDVNECAVTLLGDYFASLYNMDNAEVCAIGDKTDTCQGDSGGPLFRMTSDGEEERPEIIGLTSWGFGCAVPDLPAVYTSTSHHYGWIADTLGWTRAPTAIPTPAPIQPDDLDDIVAGIYGRSGAPIAALGTGLVSVAVAVAALVWI